ncbi:MAG: hypothetical protein LC099_09565 [Anaerolineales bacterium]|nr:hypothetical protein [Anaerolineales bacterium]
MEILYSIHLFLRWLIVLVALVAIVKFALGWLKGGAFKGMDRGLSAAFSGLMDLQATLGIALLIWMAVGGAEFAWQRAAHGLIMIVAAVLGHLPARWKGAADSVRFRNALFCILAAFVLIFVGVAIII